MNEPWEQDDGLDGDDFVEGLDDEQEELGIDYTARHGGAHPLEDAPPQPASVAVRKPALPRPAQRQRPQGGSNGRKFRVKAMSERMAARSHGVVSILITREDGSQVLLVKNGR